MRGALWGGLGFRETESLEDGKQRNHARALFTRLVFTRLCFTQRGWQHSKWASKDSTEGAEAVSGLGAGWVGPEQAKAAFWSWEIAVDDFSVRERKEALSNSKCLG